MREKEREIEKERDRERDREGERERKRELRYLTFITLSVYLPTRVNYKALL